MNHTPTPWIADGTTIMANNSISLHIAYLHEKDGTPLTQQSSGNARLITNSVNNHFYLVEHLKLAIKWLELMEQSEQVKNQINAWNRVIARAEGVE